MVWWKGSIEHLRPCFKSMLLHLVTMQWDRYLYGVLWAYCKSVILLMNRLKKNLLLYCFDLTVGLQQKQHIYLPPEALHDIDVADYRQELMVSVTSARELAAQNIRRAQDYYKKHYNRRAKPAGYKVGQWVLIRFPHEESGHLRKLS